MNIKLSMELHIKEDNGEKFLVPAFFDYKLAGWPKRCCQEAVALIALWDWPTQDFSCTFPKVPEMFPALEVSRDYTEYLIAPAKSYYPALVDTNRINSEWYFLMKAMIEVINIY